MTLRTLLIIRIRKNIYEGILLLYFSFIIQRKNSLVNKIAILKNISNYSSRCFIMEKITDCPTKKRAALSSSSVLEGGEASALDPVLV